MRTDLELLKNAIDIHVHSAPDLYRRIADHFEVARAARDAGFRALVIKSHNFGTAARAHMVQKEVRGIDVFGGMVCNLAMGGLNPVAVETALKYGARQIYLPTVDSANHASLTGGEIGQHGKGLVVEGGWSEYTRTRPRLHLLDERGQLTLEVQQIVKLCAEADVILNCGHVSYPEMERVLEAARARGFRKVVVDHPFFTRLSVKEQEALAAGGAWMNYTVGEILPRWWRVSVEDFVGTIRRLGVDRVLLSSDCGQLHNPPVVEGIRLAIQLLLEDDFSEHDIRTLVHDNAARLLYE